MVKDKHTKAAKRTDNRGRILHTGEHQQENGRYCYTAVDPVTKERKYIYSWKLERHDPTPAGKRKDKSLREKIADLRTKNYIGVSLDGAGLTVAQLVDKYIETKRAVKPATLAGYKTCQNFLKNDPFGKKRIDQVTVMDAKQWLIRLQDIDKKSYSAIHNLRGVVRPAFQLAVESDYIFKNPFNFELKGVLIDDSQRREAISIDDERRFLEFIKSDKHYSRYYDPVLILFRTGLRIGEFCGLRLEDIDLEKRVIDVNHQLQYNSGTGKNIQTTKSEAGNRKLPMTEEVFQAFIRVLKNRKTTGTGEVIDGYTNFIFLGKNETVMVGYQWEQIFDRIIQKHNKIYKNELKKITPHMCRHTYCTKMAATGISVQKLKYLMGHTDIQTTMNVYTHLSLDDVKKDIEQIDTELENSKLLELDKEKNECKIINFADYA